MSAFKQNKDYEEYPSSRGEILKIYAVPQPIIRAVVPQRPKPEIPTVDMQLPKGGAQKRPAKPGDTGWDAYATALEEWEAERDDLQEAITFCMALKTYKFPADLSLSPEVQTLVDMGMLKIPDNPFVRKFTWLRENVLGQHDEYQIRMLIHKLSGVPEELIEEMKRNFRDTLLGKTSRTLAESNGDEANQSEANVQE